MVSVQGGGMVSGGEGTARSRKGANGAGSGTGAEGSPGAGTSSDAIEQTIAEDPLMKFVQRRWREIALLLLAVFAILYGKNVFEETRRESRSRSADLLLNLQSQVEQLRVGIEELKKKELEAAKGASDKEGEKKEAAAGESKEGELQALRKKLDQNIDAASELNRALAQERAPYSELPSLYAGLLSGYRSVLEQSGTKDAVNKEGVNNDAGAQKKEQAGEVQVTVSQLRELLSDKALQAGGFLAELKVFQGALVLLDREGASSEVVGILRDLVAQARFTGVPALLALSALVENSGRDKQPDDKQSGSSLSSEELKGLAASYVERNPEQAAMLRRELPQLL